MSLINPFVTDITDIRVNRTRTLPLPNSCDLKIRKN